LPAAKIGRIGVCAERKGGGVGTKILDYLKYSFTHNNKTGCRFLLVDAYSSDVVLRFYQKNGFRFLTDQDSQAKTRIMYFDLAQFRE
jgi:GNAT superfamily N-acetyltransferase